MCICVERCLHFFSSGFSQAPITEVVDHSCSTLSVCNNLKETMPRWEQVGEKNIMKKLVNLGFAIMAFLICGITSSCGSDSDDSENEVQSYSQIIVGIWSAEKFQNVDYSGNVINEGKEDEVWRFQNDGYAVRGKHDNAGGYTWKTSKEKWNITGTILSIGNNSYTINSMNSKTMILDNKRSSDIERGFWKKEQ